MSRLLKLLIIVVVVAALVGSSAYVYFFTGTQNGGGSGSDTTPPVIESVTGNTTGTTGKTTRIEASFSDNVAPTSAFLYYRKAGETNWTNVSILNGSALITIPMGLAVNYEYYVTVYDAAGNEAGSPSKDGSSFYVITVQQENVTLAHHVLIEEATYTECAYCPTIAEILHSLEQDEPGRFSYVALIDDKNADAKNRTTDYNVQAYPALFIDGGYLILVGSNHTKAEVAAAIADAANRSVPPLLLTVTASNTSSQAKVTVNITNYRSSAYMGTLRVYMTARNSYAYYGGAGIYHYGLTDILTNETVTVPAYGRLMKNYTITGNNTDFDNMAVIAAIYNRTGVQKDSNPAAPGNAPFTAYYVDASNSTLVVPGGNLPPEVGITFPISNSLNLKNRHILAKIKPKVTTCLGRFTVTVKATDNDSGISRVEFYLDGKLVNNQTTGPYSWKWPLLKGSLGIRTHTLTVTAFDTKGKNATTSLVIRLIGL